MVLYLLLIRQIPNFSKDLNFEITSYAISNSNQFTLQTTIGQIVGQIIDKLTPIKRFSH